MLAQVTTPIHRIIFLSQVGEGRVHVRYCDGEALEVEHPV